tara:strand:- start:310 stop:885 length:576 start_codon:yes stop_codon:yes gene_type:complete
MDTKKCTKCAEEKTKEYFTKDSATKDGYYPSCKVCKKKHREANKEKIKGYYQASRERYIKQAKEWYEANREKKIAHQIEYNKKRYNSDENFKMACTLRSRVNHALKGKSKSASTMELLGCTIGALWLHLESQFTEGMTRQNRGRWHIDHIIPCAAFDLTDPEQQRKCFHWSNLQPLWALENISKGAKYEKG